MCFKVLTPSHAQQPSRAQQPTQPTASTIYCQTIQQRNKAEDERREKENEKYMSAVIRKRKEEEFRLKKKEDKKQADLRDQEDVRKRSSSGVHKGIIPQLNSVPYATSTYEQYKQHVQAEELSLATRESREAKKQPVGFTKEGKYILKDDDAKIREWLTENQTEMEKPGSWRVSSNAEIHKAFLSFITSDDDEVNTPHFRLRSLEQKKMAVHVPFKSNRGIHK